MSLLFTLKVLAVLSFYFAYANALTVIFGGSQAMPALIILGAAAYIGASVRHNLRLAALVFLPLCFIIMPLNLANIAIIAPAALFVAYSLANIKILNNRFVGTGAAKAFFLLFLPAAFLLYLHESTQYVGIVLVPFSIVFAVCTVLVLRTVRHRASLQASRAFNIINTATVISVFALGVILGSSTVVAQFSRFMQWFYNTLLFPFVSGILYVFLRIIAFMLDPIAHIDLRIQEDVTHEYVDIYDVPDLELITNHMGEMHPLLVPITATVLILVAVFTIFFTLKYFAKTGDHPTFSSIRAKIKFFELAPKTPKAEVYTPRPRGHERRLRDVYKRFLALCVRRGIQRQVHMTSADYHHRFEKIFGQIPELEEFRNIYVSARYSGQPIEREQVRRAKELYKQIRKASKI